MFNESKNKVFFADEKIKNFFEKLKCGTSEEKQLYNFIDRAINDLCIDPRAYIEIRREKWPKEYIRKYRITNLWKYDLPNGWRLIYTMKKEKVEIMSIILEWFSHKEYERKFGY